jgi:hypothetical protein
MASTLHQLFSRSGPSAVRGVPREERSDPYMRRFFFKFMAALIMNFSLGSSL